MIIPIGSKIFASFSGGKTSAYMTKRILKEYGDTNEIVVAFDNTGQEHPKTLDFVHKCDKEFSFNLAWIESVVHHNQRKSCTSTVVNYETACRDHKLFEEMIKKYGIPNKDFPHCTRELKTRPLHHYIRETIGWKKGEYFTAIGIRCDEIDRVSVNYESLKYCYPLIGWEIDKEFIRNFWEKQSFQLEITDHLGNCTWCWKKTLSKQMAIIRDMPEVHKIPMMLEKKYANAGAGEGERVFFRENKSANDLYEIYNSGNSRSFVDEYFNDCKESCEAF